MRKCKTKDVLFQFLVYLTARPQENKVDTREAKKESLHFESL